MGVLKLPRAKILQRMMTAGLAGSALALLIHPPALLQSAPPSPARTMQVSTAQPDVHTLPPTTPCPDGAEQLLTLADCRRLALEKQPSVAAARSDLALAQERYKAITHLRGLALLERDYKIRKEQSCLGVHVAEAGLVQAESEAVYAATRLYFSVLYARAQLAFAADVKEQLEKLQNAAEIKPKVFNENHRQKIQGYMDILIERREEAIQGEKRALAALREALGMTGDCHLRVVAAPLPDFPVSLNCEELAALAVSRRGEAAQANLAVELTHKEVGAQGTSYLPSKKTFASGGDIHSRPVPAPNFGAEYHPGALAPEMPPFMVGWRKDRVDQTLALESRASAVAEKTQNLIVLETENHFFRLQENLNKLQSLRKALGDKDSGAQQRLNKQMDLLDQDKKFEADELLTAGEFVTRLKLAINQAHYQYLLELAALERVTAGGYCPGFETVEQHKP